MSTQTPDETPEPRTLMDEAALWFGRLQGPEADQHRPAFEAWLARGALHRAAYNRAGEVYALGKFLKEPHSGGKEWAQRDGVDWAKDAAGVAAHRPTGHLAVRVGVACTVTILVMISAVLVSQSSLPSGVLPSPTLRERQPLVLATRDHQILTQMLADGSRVTLGANSGLTIAYSRKTRHLRLDHGQASFIVAHDHRPFIVNAACGSVTARGTKFEVAMLSAQRVVVHLLEGQVAVAIPGDDRPQATRNLLRAGETISYTADGKGPIRTGIVSASAASLDTSLLVQSENGLRAFRNVPLRDVLLLVNGRSRTAHLYASPDIANLKISGRFGVDDPLRLARRLAVLFDLVVDHRSERTIVLRRS